MNPLVQNTTQKVRVIPLPNIHHAESESDSSGLNNTQKVKVMSKIHHKKVTVMSLPKIHQVESESGYFCRKHNIESESDFSSQNTLCRT